MYGITEGITTISASAITAINTKSMTSMKSNTGTMSRGMIKAPLSITQPTASSTTTRGAAKSDYHHPLHLKLIPHTPSFIPKLTPHPSSLIPKFTPHPPSLIPKLTPHLPSLIPKLTPYTPSFIPKHTPYPHPSHCLPHFHTTPHPSSHAASPSNAALHPPHTTPHSSSLYHHPALPEAVMEPRAYRGSLHSHRKESGLRIVQGDRSSDTEKVAGKLFRSTIKSSQSRARMYGLDHANVAGIRMNLQAKLDEVRDGGIKRTPTRSVAHRAHLHSRDHTLVSHNFFELEDEMLEIRWTVSGFPTDCRCKDPLAELLDQQCTFVSIASLNSKDIIS